VTESATNHNQPCGPLLQKAARNAAIEEGRCSEVIHSKRCTQGPLEQCTPDFFFLMVKPPTPACSVACTWGNKQAGNLFHLMQPMMETGWVGRARLCGSSRQAICDRLVGEIEAEKADGDENACLGRPCGICTTDGFRIRGNKLMVRFWAGLHYQW
jgi:hypothetical protein